MDRVFENRHILFFGPQTFNYEREIVLALERMGATVTYRSDKPWRASWLKALIRVFPKLAWRAADRLYRPWLEREGPRCVDTVLVVKGEGLSPGFLAALRSRYPAARFILYLWDSIANVRHVEAKFFAFDAFFSFDPEDCRKHSRFRYRPLFFVDSYRSGASQAGRGLFFLGTLNGDRPRVLAKLVDSLQSAWMLDYWLFVRSRLELRIRQIYDKDLRKLDEKRFLRQPMTAAAASARIAECAAVVDIEHPRQTGLTMRTFEVLASGKKLVTTNRQIQAHEFYDPARVCVIDRYAPTVPDGFLGSKPAPLTEVFFEKYSIQGWLKEILGAGLASRQGALANA